MVGEKWHGGTCTSQRVKRASHNKFKAMSGVRQRCCEWIQWLRGFGTKRHVRRPVLRAPVRGLEIFSTKKSTDSTRCELVRGGLTTRAKPPQGTSARTRRGRSARWQNPTQHHNPSKKSGQSRRKPRKMNPSTGNPEKNLTR